MAAAHNFRLSLKKVSGFKGVQKPTNGTIWIAKTFPPWQSCVLDTMRTLYEVRSNKLSKDFPTIIMNILQQNNSELPDNKLISIELGKKEILKKHMKKVMPFVAGTRERIKELGKAAMQVTVDFDECEILKTNQEYLRNTLELETIEICFTDDPTSNDKLKESVCPGSPLIAYTIKPLIQITLENPVPRSGMFTQTLNVTDGDTTKEIKEKLATNLKLAINAVEVWRFEDPVLGPRKLPIFNDYKTGKVQLEDGVVSLDSKNEIVYITTAEGKKIDVGTSFIYIIV